MARAIPQPWHRRLVAALAALAWLAPGGAVADTETRGVARIDGVGASGPVLADHYSASYALLVGVERYAHPGWNRLPTIPDELESVGAMLARQGFEVEMRHNLGGRALLDALSDFVADKGFDENNRLLIYFSGHGETVTQPDGRQMGYFVPADAPPYRADPRAFRTRALSMNRVMATAREIRSKHALFVFDSCFSGSLFQSRGFGGNHRSLEKLLTKPVRYFITSGSADETVPSDSAFTRAFVDAFESGAADLNRDGYVTGTELGLHLTQNVRLGEQTPQHGKINHYELSQGDLVFASLAEPGERLSSGSLSAQAIAHEYRLRAELSYWRGLMAAPSAAGFEEYLRRYPDGQFSVLARAELRKLPPPADPAVPASKPRIGLSPTKMILTSVHWAGDWSSATQLRRTIEGAMAARLERRGVEAQPLHTERSSGPWIKRRRATYGIDRRVFAHLTDADQGIMGMVVRLRDDNSKGELQFVYSSGQPERLSRRYHFNSDFSLKRAVAGALDEVLEGELELVLK